MVVEGVNATRTVLALARRSDVELPITAQVARILFDGLSPTEALAELMTREMRAEAWP